MATLHAVILSNSSNNITSVSVTDSTPLQVKSDIFQVPHSVYVYMTITACNEKFCVESQVPNNFSLSRGTVSSV